MGLRTKEVEELIVHLISEKFLNEERCAKAFAGGKFRMKNWGRIKITNALEGKGISAYCVKAGLAEVDNEDYIETLRKILEKNEKDIAEENTYFKRNTLARYAIQKGFEPELVWLEVKQIIPDKR
jgi:regulatory protein